MISFVSPQLFVLNEYYTKLGKADILKMEEIYIKNSQNISLLQNIITILGNAYHI